MRSRYPAVAALLLLLIAACSGSSRTAPVTAPGLAVVTPANGAIDVEPDVVISLVFDRDTSAPENFVRIEDAGVWLSGTFLAGASPTEWTWQPDQELPRGGRIEVRLTSGGGSLASSFSVREVQAESIFQLPDTLPVEALSWPNGRRVVTYATRTFEATQSGLIERFVQIPRGAQTFGDGRFVAIDKATSP